MQVKSTVSIERSPPCGFSEHRREVLRSARPSLVLVLGELARLRRVGLDRGVARHGTEVLLLDGSQGHSLLRLRVLVASVGSSSHTWF